MFWSRIIELLRINLKFGWKWIILHNSNDSFLMIIENAFNILMDTSFSGNVTSMPTTKGIADTSFVPQAGKRYAIRLTVFAASRKMMDYINK